MNYLNNILTEEQISEIEDTFDEGILNKLNEDNLKSIITYLKMNQIYFIEDILIQYLDLFLMEKEQFIKRFEILKIKYSYNFVETLAHNLNILEEMLTSESIL